MSEEQRLTNRIPFEDNITIRSPIQVSGEAVDIGAGGIGIQIAQELEPGTAVEMEILSGHAITYGTVRWCRPHENEFRVGVQFRQEDWSIIELVLTLRAQEG